MTWLCRIDLAGWVALAIIVGIVIAVALSLFGLAEQPDAEDE